MKTMKTMTKDTRTATAMLREQIYDFILRSGNAGLTDHEICSHFDIGGDTIRPRRNELVKAKLVDSSGMRRRVESGRTATIWKSTKVLKKKRAVG